MIGEMGQVDGGKRMEERREDGEGRWRGKRQGRKRKKER